jgi:hypothetical protein
MIMRQQHHLQYSTTCQLGRSVYHGCRDTLRGHNCKVQVSAALLLLRCLHLFAAPSNFMLRQSVCQQEIFLMGPKASVLSPNSQSTNQCSLPTSICSKNGRRKDFAGSFAYCGLLLSEKRTRIGAPFLGIDIATAPLDTIVGVAFFYPKLIVVYCVPRWLRFE